MTEQKSPATFIIMDSKVHEDILKSMVQNDIDPTDADKILIAYTLSVSEFFRGLQKEGHSQEKIEGWVDWMAENIKHNVNPPDYAGP